MLPRIALTQFRAVSQEAGLGCRKIPTPTPVFAQSVNCESEAFRQAAALPNKVWFFQNLEESEFMWQGMRQCVESCITACK